MAILRCLRDPDPIRDRATAVPPLNNMDTVLPKLTAPLARLNLDTLRRAPPVVAAKSP